MQHPDTCCCSREAGYQVYEYWLICEPASLLTEFPVKGTALSYSPLGGKPCGVTKYTMGFVFHSTIAHIFYTTLSPPSHKKSKKNVCFRVAKYREISNANINELYIYCDVPGCDPVLVKSGSNVRFISF